MMVAYVTPPEDLQNLIDASDLIVEGTLEELSRVYSFDWMFPVCSGVVAVVICWAVWHRTARRFRVLLCCVLALGALIACLVSVRKHFVLHAVADKALYGSLDESSLSIELGSYPVILDASRLWVLFLRTSGREIRPAWPEHFALPVSKGEVLWNRGGSIWTYDQLVAFLQAR